MTSPLVLTGSAESIRASATRWSGFAQVAAQAAADLRSLSADEFQGDEADLYREKLHADLPSHLDTVDQAWTTIAGALSTYADTLESCQTRLTSLAADHAEQEAQVTRADQALADARTADHRHGVDRRAAQDELTDGQTLPPDHYRPQTSGAESDLANARAARQATVDAANGIRTEHTTAVDLCVSTIDQAKSWRFEDPPGWFERLLSAVGDWIAEHADILTALSSVLKTISGIAGVLALIPVLAPIAGPVALATGGAALALDAGVMLATGEGDLLTFGVEALALIPGVRAAKTAMVVETAVVTHQVATGEAGIADMAMTVGLSALGSTTGRRAQSSDIDQAGTTSAEISASSRPDLLYRSDDRAPSVIFAEGFAPRAPGSLVSLLTFVRYNAPSRFVSTSTDPEFYRRWGARYRYIVDHPGGIDVNRALGRASPHPHELEIAFDGGIPASSIVGVQEILPDLSLGRFIANPNYVRRAAP